MAKALGTDDSVTTCDCCGRVNLKFTVTMQLDGGEVVHYGTTCAARNTGKTQPVIAREIRDEKRRRIDAATSELIGAPEYLALRAKLAARPRTLVGMAAADFVRAEMVAEMNARHRIATKHGLSGPFAFSI